MSEDVEGKVQVIQNTLYAKASQEPRAQFKRLYHNLFKAQWAEIAVDQVFRNQGSRTAGIDGKARGDYRDERARVNLTQSLIEELRTHTYHPQPVRRVYIPKANGKLRPLGIPTIRDRVVQQMVKMLLEPIYEATFLPCSYGFRPNRSTWDALAEAYYFLQPIRHYHVVIEGDITNCFGTIHHGTLMRQLKRRIADDSVLRLIWQMLQAGYLEDLQQYATTEGTPQGGIVSPLLANVYLHQLDEWLYYRFHTLTNAQRQQRARKGEIAYVRYIRYADDFIVVTRHEEQAVILKQEIAEFVTQQLKMTLNDEKTLITPASQGFDFLGVRTIVGSQNQAGKPMPYQIPSDKSIQAYRRKLKELTRRNLDHLDPVQRLLSINRLIRGWANYHRWGNAKAAFRQLAYWTGLKVNRMLSRRQRTGQRLFRQANMYPLSECANLKRWEKYAEWKTPSVLADENTRIGLLPMSVISTAEYWKYRGGKIPPAYGWQANTTDWRRRDADFATDVQVIDEIDTMLATLGQRLWADEKYDLEYFLNRKLVLQRDRYTCTQCGYRSQRKEGDVSDVEVHHLRPDGGHGLNNLTTVCRPCHRRLTTTERAG